MLFSTIFDLSKSEKIYIQKCKLQAPQDVLISKLLKLLQKVNTILKIMERLETNMSNFNWFYVEEVLETLEIQL